MGKYYDTDSGIRTLFGDYEKGDSFFYIGEKKEGLPS
jgi:hypothetical protein